MSDGADKSKPWLSVYSPGLPSHISPAFTSILDAFQAAVVSQPETVAIQYFDGSLTFRQLDEASAKLAAVLIANGFLSGDRLGLYLQNDPAFVIGLLAAWKAGGAAVAISPMNKARELTYLLQDSGAVALLCLDSLYEEVAQKVLASGSTRVSFVVTASAMDGQSLNDSGVVRGEQRTAETPGIQSLRAIIVETMKKAQLPLVQLSADDLAILTYTSGTTGKPKGAMNTHGNLRFTAQAYRDWVGLTPEDLILGIAPLFHVTGIVAHVALSLITQCPLILTHRFIPDLMLEVIRKQRPTFTIGAITAFMSLLNVPGARRDDFSSFRAIYTGGAPMSPATAKAFEDFTGIYLHNAFGMTETCSPTHLVPLGARAPVDEVSGAISIGVPIFNTCVQIIDDDGRMLRAGEIGEIVDKGPQVMRGYWQNPEATCEALTDGWLRTGDIGFMDEEGWFYLVDRKKDMIIVSGYKVWPREVEDVLYSHPAVREAIVVGVADEYRGETVKAVVSLKPGCDVGQQELIEYCKANLAAYKYPRLVEVVDDLPKTASGKLLRRAVRDEAG